MTSRLKKSIPVIVAAILLCAVLLFVFFPRSIGDILFDKDGSLSAVTVSVTHTGNNDTVDEYTFTGEELEKFRALADKSYVFLNPFRKKSVNGTGTENLINIFPEYSDRTQAEGVPPYAYVFTSRIITIDNTQYYFYGNSFLEELEDFTE